MRSCFSKSAAAGTHCRARLIASAALVLSLSLLFGTALAEGEPSDFHSLSPSERDAWMNDLGKVLDESKGGSKGPVMLDGDTMGAQPWERFKDGISWRIDDAGFVVIDGDERPMGSRIFARSCYIQHGDSFSRWATSYARGLKAAHLVATAITESGCSEAAGYGSVDNKSTGLMQVTGYTCRHLLNFLGRPDMTQKACLDKMAQVPDFSIELAAAYMTQPVQIKMTDLDPPKVAAAYNAGGVYFDAKNPWRFRCTGNHIDRFVSAYNAFVAWQRDEVAGRKTRSPAVHLTRSATMPQSVPNVTALNGLIPIAKEGDIVFVGDLTAERGDYYVFVQGDWRGSLEDSEKQ